MISVPAGQLQALADALRDLSKNRMPLRAAMQLYELGKAVDDRLPPFVDQWNRWVRECSGGEPDLPKEDPRYEEWLEGAERMREEPCALPCAPIQLASLGAVVHVSPAHLHVLFTAGVLEGS